MTNTQKEKAAETARSLVGVPYRWGTSPEEAPAAFDCSSFVQYVMKTVGIEVPRSTILQAEAENGTEISPNEDFSNLEVGDLLFMRSDRGYYHDESFGGRNVQVGHVVIYLGNGEVAHARKARGGVITQKLAELITEPNYAITFAKRYR